MVVLGNLKEMTQRWAYGAVRSKPGSLVIPGFAISADTSHSDCGLWRNTQRKKLPATLGIGVKDRSISQGRHHGTT